MLSSQMKEIILPDDGVIPPVKHNVFTEQAWDWCNSNGLKSLRDVGY